MNYHNYDKSIILKYKVKLTGWPNNIKFANPSHISTVDDIRMLRHSLQTGVCHWVRLSQAEAAEHGNNIIQRQQDGEIVGRKHKERSDKGRWHAVRARNDEHEDEGPDEDEGPSRKQRARVAAPNRRSKRLMRHSSGKGKSKAVISSEEEYDEDEGKEEEVDMEDEFSGDDDDVAV